MKWIVVVLFATMQGDMYVFTEPAFDTRKECMIALSDNRQREKIIMKLIEEYGQPMPIDLVNCIQYDRLMELINGQTAT